MKLERYRSVIPDWAAFAEACARPEPTVFRVRTGRVGTSQLVSSFAAQGFELRPLDGMPDFFRVTVEPFPVSFTLEHWAGLIYVQQASTGVAAPALAPRPGDRVLDLCAAPGGKTAHAAELMEESGCLVASDISESRIRGLLGNLYRLGYTNVLTVAGDGRAFPTEASFDRVLVDAPCTGEGTLRRRGGEPPRQSASFLGYVTRAQEALLRRAIAVTRPGGTVLYVTCTFAPEENEAVVSAVLGDAPVELEPLELPVPHAPGLTAFEDARYDPRLEGAARIYPHHLDSGGLFLARLRRLDDGQARPEPEEWGPLPTVFPGEALEVDDALAMRESALALLRDRFAVDPEVLERLGWTMRGGRLWAHSLAEWPLEAWAPGGWRPISVGFRAVEFDSRSRPRPTNDLLQWLGDRITAATLELDGEAFERLLARERLPPSPEHEGFVALRWRGRVLGRGIALADGVRSEVPKVRVKDLARAAERRRQASD